MTITTRTLLAFSNTTLLALTGAALGQAELKINPAALLCGGPGAVMMLAGGPPASDFDDGTLQGWTPEEPFGGALNWDDNGNPLGAMLALDTIAGGGGLAARAPEEYTGDLSGYLGLRWDEFLPSQAVISTDMRIQGADGTTYLTPVPAPETGVWRTRMYEFASCEWTLVSGEASFDEVLSNVAAVFIGLDVTTCCLTEAKVDNIALVEDLDPCPGDVNDDFTVNGADLAAVLAAWGPTADGNNPADIDRNCIVDAADLAAVLSDWGNCP